MTSDSILEAAGRSPHGADPDEARIIIARVRRKAGLLGPSQGVRKERVVMYYFDDGADSCAVALHHISIRSPSVDESTGRIVIRWPASVPRSGS